MKKGFYSDQTGYSGAFTWYRSEARPGFWTVLGFHNFCKDGLAVVDDFGTLVEVQR